LASAGTLKMATAGSLEKDLGNGLKLHIGSALVDGSDLGVAIEFLHGIFPGESIPSEKVHGRGRNPTVFPVFSHSSTGRKPTEPVPGRIN